MFAFRPGVANWRDNGVVSLECPQNSRHLNSWSLFGCWHYLGGFRRFDLVGGSMALGVGFESMETGCISSSFSLLCTWGSRCELLAPATIPATMPAAVAAAVS